MGEPVLLHILRYYEEGQKPSPRAIGIELTEEVIWGARDRLRKSCRHLELRDHTPCSHSIFLFPEGTVDTTNIVVSKKPYLVLTSTFQEGLENLARQNELPYDAEQVLVWPR
jgi:hypothetical protein